MIKRQQLIFLLFLCTTLMTAQTQSDFENLSLDTESFLNGDDGSGGFTSGNIFLPNTYNDIYDFWQGWAISNITDISTPGFGNQYAAITGGGANNSPNYAVTFVSGASYIALQNEAAGEPVSGLYITNSTYAYLSMLDGDAFAKKFGGPTGDDPDFFLLTIKKYENGTLSADSIDFYLADYRFSDNTQDYIVDDWSFVDLTSLGEADSLVFTLSSTDVGQFGMNTPGYFCIDNATTSDGTTAINSIHNDIQFEVFPNPATDFIYLKNTKEAMRCSVYDMQGNVLLSQNINRDLLMIDIQALASGAYVVELINGRERNTQLFIKQ